MTLENRFFPRRPQPHILVVFSLINYYPVDRTSRTAPRPTAAMNSLNHPKEIEVERLRDP